MTFLHYAILSNYSVVQGEIIDLYLDANIDLDLSDQSGNCSLYYLYWHGGLSPIRTQCREDLVHKFVVDHIKNNRDLSIYTIENTCNPDWGKKYIPTWLMEILYRETESDYYLNLYLNYIVDKGIQLGKDEEGVYCFIEILNNQPIEFVKKILENEDLTNPNLMNHLCRTRQDIFEYVLQLVDKRHININKRDSYGNTPLAFIADNGNQYTKEMLELYDRKGWDMDIPDGTGELPLGKIYRTCGIELLQFLLDMMNRKFDKEVVLQYFGRYDRRS